MYLRIGKIFMLGFQLRGGGGKDSFGVTHYWQVYPWQVDDCYPSVSPVTQLGEP